MGAEGVIAGRRVTHIAANGSGHLVRFDPIVSTSPTATITDATFAEGNRGTTNATFNVTLASPSDKAVTLSYATADDTARASSDYTRTSGTLVFNPGEVSKSISVPVAGNTLNEGDESFFVNLSNAAGAVIGDSQAIGTIVDDDPLPQVRITDAAALEGGAALFSVTLSAPSGRTVTVRYATANNTAVAPGDYTSASGTLTFAPGQTRQDIPRVVMRRDAIAEGLESFFVNLGDAPAADIVDTQGLGVIAAQIVLPTLKINDVKVREGNSGPSSATFTVTLSPAQAAPVSVDYATVDGSARSGSDYIGTRGTLTFARGETTKTITVSVQGDRLGESDESFKVRLANPKAAALSRSEGTGTIVDDD